MKIKSNDLSCDDKEEVLKYIEKNGEAELVSMDFIERNAHSEYCVSVSDEWIDKNVRTLEWTVRNKTEVTAEEAITEVIKKLNNDNDK